MKIINNRIEEIREVVNTGLREAALKLIHAIFMEEVSELCGGRYIRKSEELAMRSGSDPGSVLVSGRRVKVKKPRVKKDGKEVALQSYQALQDFDLLNDKVMAHMLSGVSTRNYDGLLDEMAGSTGLKKSTVSKAFKRGSKKKLDELNGRNLSKFHFVAMMIDTIYFGDMAVVVALGIDRDGRKMVLGLKQGATEDWQVVRDLFRNLIDRGFVVHHKLLFIVDGAKALKKAIHKFFGQGHAIQRCTIHKQRNILKYLDKKHHAEFKRRWRKLHGNVDYEAAKKDYKSLVRHLGEINYEAVNSLEEANMETMTVIRLNTPKLLRRTLHSTNPIESMFEKAKSKMGRVKNWTQGADQVARWSAASLLEAETGFKRLKGYKQMPMLIEELKKLDLQQSMLAA